MIGLAVLIAAGASTGTWSTTRAQRTMAQTAEAPNGRPTWFASAEGWQVGVWGQPGAHRWRIAGDGRGSITLPGPPRAGGARPVEHDFALTVPEHVRFAGLIERFTTGPQDEGLCMSDQAQDIIQWRGGTRGDGLFNFDHGCRDAANTARLALLTEALGILREAAARQAGG
jgi:hypothetical protein